MKRTAVIAIVCIVLAAFGLVMWMMAGAGGIQRVTTISGVYPICKPQGYPALCFANKSGGGFSCIPYTGECK